MKVLPLQQNNLKNISRYLKSLPSGELSRDFPLDKIDVRHLEGIQQGIDVFENVSMSEIKFLAKNFSILNLARGCSNACTHCLRNAKSDVKSTMLWENLVKFTEGVKDLNFRLGFNFLNGNKYMVLHDDSNPPEFVLRDLVGYTHNFADAVKQVFSRLNIPIETVTTGWNKSDTNAEKAANELMEYFTKTPEANILVSISVNPFHRLLDKSRQAAHLGNPDTAQYFRELYTDRIARAINTFLPLFKSEKAALIYRYSQFDKNTGAKELMSLYRTIYEKLEHLAGKDCLAEINYLRPETFENFSPEHLIESKGRGRRYFPLKENLKKQQELLFEKSQWETSSPAESIREAYKYSIKEVDTDGRVYARTLSETVIPTNISLNFSTPQNPLLFSDIQVAEIQKENIKKYL